MDRWGSESKNPSISSQRWWFHGYWILIINRLSINSHRSRLRRRSIDEMIVIVDWILSDKIQNRGSGFDPKSSISGTRPGSPRRAEFGIRTDPLRNPEIPEIPEIRKSGSGGVGSRILGSGRRIGDPLDIRCRRSTHSFVKNHLMIFMDRLPGDRRSIEWSKIVRMVDENTTPTVIDHKSFNDLIDRCSGVVGFRGSTRNTPGTFDHRGDLKIRVAGRLDNWVPGWNINICNRVIWKLGPNQTRKNP